jgi:hypothetical protein
VRFALVANSAAVAPARRRLRVATARARVAQDKAPVVQASTAVAMAPARSVAFLNSAIRKSALKASASVAFHLRACAGAASVGKTQPAAAAVRRMPTPRAITRARPASVSAARTAVVTPSAPRTRRAAVACASSRAREARGPRARVLRASPAVLPVPGFATSLSASQRGRARVRPVARPTSPVIRRWAGASRRNRGIGRSHK